MPDVKYGMMIFMADGMRIIGIDPGYAISGFAVLDYDGRAFKVCDYGAVTTSAHTPFTDRLLILHDSLKEILERYRPDCMAIEELFFSRNTTTAIGTAQARGVLILAAAEAGVPVYEYTPMQVKVAVTGYGRAAKQQVQEMVRTLLKLKAVPKPDDVADALAIAICHGHSGNREAALAVSGYQ